MDSELFWNCLCCSAALDWDQGHISLATGELTVCRTCWGSLTPAQQIGLTAAYRQSAAVEKLAAAFVDLSRAALDGWHFHGMGEAGRN